MKRWAHAARVAGVTTAAIAVVYVVCVTVLNLVFSAHLTAKADANARLPPRRTISARSFVYRT